MRHVVYLEQVEQAEALLKPQRIEVLRQLAMPRSCTEVGHRLGQTPQRVYYHVRRLVEAGLVDPGGGAPGARHHRGHLPGRRPLVLAVAAPGRPPRPAPTPTGRRTGTRRTWSTCSTWPNRCRPTSPRWTARAPELPSIGVTGQVRVDPQTGARSSWPTCAPCCRTCSPATTTRPATPSRWPWPATPLPTPGARRGPPTTRPTSTTDVMTLRARARASLAAVHHALTDAAAAARLAGRVRRGRAARAVRLLGPVGPRRPFTARDRRPPPAPAARGRAHRPVPAGGSTSRTPRSSSAWPTMPTRRHRDHADPVAPAVLGGHAGREGQPRGRAHLLVAGHRQPGRPPGRPPAHPAAPTSPSPTQRPTVDIGAPVEPGLDRADRLRRALALVRCAGGHRAAARRPVRDGRLRGRPGAGNDHRVRAPAGG